MTETEIRDCPFCGGNDFRIDAGGQTWRGIKGYSEPQYFHLIHKGLPLGDGFQTCVLTIRGRTGPEVIAIWNGARK